MCAPASRPCSANDFLSATTSSSSSLLSRRGDDNGTSGAGLGASSPPWRWRANSSYSQVLDTPWAWATSRTERPSSTTAFTT